MLADDQQLVARDSAIAGLAEVLSVGALAGRLHQLGFPRTAEVRCDYLRYKPGSSCLVAIDAACGSERRRAYAIAFAGSQQDKLEKLAQRAPSDQVLVDDASGLAVCAFPYDRRLPSLQRFMHVDPRLVDRLSPPGVAASGFELTCLRYKPERRFVARLDYENAPLGVVKLYSRAAYRMARRATKNLSGTLSSRGVQAWGHSERHAAISFEWAPGTCLQNWESAASAAASEVGRLHRCQARKLPKLTNSMLLSRLTQASALMRWLSPKSSPQVQALRSAISRQLGRLNARQAVLHGDLHREQFVSSEDRVSLIDFDRACLGPPEWDLANLMVDLQNSAHTSEHGDAWGVFLDAYRHEAESFDPDALKVLAALRQLELAMVPFRLRENNWAHRLEERLQQSSELIRSIGQKTLSRTKPATPTDESLPWLDDACDPGEAGWRLAEIGCGMKIRAARLLRHKPGRRAVIEYCLGGENAGVAVRLVGKTEYKSRQRKRMATQRLLWDAGFDSAAPDGISVTRPMGEVPEWNMWLQEHADGENGWDALRGPSAINAAQLAARALAKLHRSSVAAPKKHNYVEEQAILNDRLTTASQMAPDLSQRIDRLRDHCSRLLDSVKDSPDVLLHRDFYPDQMLFHRDRVTLLDLDLICRGPASIDVGNFLGHLAEMGIRLASDPNYFAEAERVFLEAYLEESPFVELRSIAISKLATLARHTYISQMHVDRRAFTSEILLQCELLLAN